MKRSHTFRILTKSFLFCISFLLISFSTGDNRSQYSIPRAAYSVTAGDIDLDGDNDIVVGHKFSSQVNWGGVSVIENTGDGYFQISDSLFVNNGFPYIHVDHFDENEYLDIFSGYVTTDPYTVYIGVIYNYGLFQFDSIKSFLIQHDSPVHYFCSGDIDNDNYNDIAFASNSGQFWGVMYNDGNGNFSNPEYNNISGSYPTDIACGDLNNDGREDVVICGAKVEIFFSTENGFQQYQLGENELRVHITDMNNDGDNDIVGLTDLYLVGYTGISVYENLGDNSFIEHEQYDFQPSASEFVVSDVNNDSLPDLVITSHFPDANLLDQTDTIGGIYILYNQGEFQLSVPQFLPIENYGEYSRKSYCADMDGNHYDDIITIRYLHAQLPANVNILFNDGNGNFAEDPITKINTLESKSQNILSCYPNPFTTEITISITIEISGFTQLQVFDLNGRLVRTLINRDLQTGNYKFKWNGTDKTGKEVKSGLYLIRLKAGRQIMTRSVKIIK